MDKKLSCGMVILLLCLAPALLWAQTVTFSLGSGSGELGTSDHPVEVSTDHIVDLSRVAFTVEYDPAKLDVSAVSLTGRVIEGAGLSFNWSKPTSGSVAVVIERPSGMVIRRGTGTIASIFFDVAEDAPLGDVILSFSDASAENIAGESLPAIQEDGSFAIFSLPNLALSEESHDFGGILVGISETWILTVSNVGTDILIVDNLLATHSQFSLELPAMPQVMNAGQSFDVQVTFTPTGVGSVAGSLKVWSNDPDHAVLSLFITGEGIEPDIALSDSSHDYGHIVVGSTSEWGLFIFNTGKAPLAVLSVSFDHPEFSLVSPTFPKIIASLDSIEATIAFSPQSLETVSTTLTVLSTDADEETLTVSLSGQGVDGPDIAVSTVEHDFGQVMKGASVDWTITISNDGTTALTIDRIDFDTSGFLIYSHVFPVTVAAGEHIDVSMMFTPDMEGVFVVEMTIVSDDPDEGNLVVTLLGESIVPRMELSATSHDFGQVVRGESTTWDFTISNNGTAPLTIQSVTSNHDDFDVTSPSFPQTVDIGSSIDVTVVFTPTGMGAESARLTISNNDPDQLSVTVNLSGESLYPVIALSATAHDFGDVVLDSLGTWTFSANNEGSVPLTISTLTSSHPDVSVASPSVPQTLTIGGSIDVEVHFIPTSQGAMMAQLSLQSDDPVNETVIVELTGNGIAPVIVLVERTTGEPGDEGISIPVVIDNVVPVAQAEFSILYDPTLLTVTDAAPAGRAVSMNTFSWSQIGPGQIVLLLSDFTGNFIDPGTGPISYIQVTVAEMAPPATADIRLAGVAVFDSFGEEYELATVDGFFTVLVEDIHISPAEHDFGGVGVGVPAEWIFSIINAGTKELSVDSLLSDNSIFTITGPGFPQTILPSGEVEVTAVFTPPYVGDISGQFQIFSSDPDEDTFFVSLIGQGIPTALLEVSGGVGESGSAGNLIQIELENWVAVLGLECLLSFDAEKLGVADVQPTERSEPLGLLSWTTPAEGQVRIVISSVGGDMIPIGSGAVADLFVDVQEDAPAGDVALTLHGVKVYDGLGEPVVSAGQGGIFAVGSADIRLESLSHSYGYVAVGDSGSWTTQIFNDGHFALEVEEVSSDVNAFFASTPVFPQAVSPGESLAVTILFAPADTGTVLGTITVASNDPDESTLEMTVSGTGAHSRMTLPVQEYSYGTVGVGTSAEWQLAVFNFEPVDLLLNALSTDRSEFEIVWPSEYPVRIAPGEHIGAIISFTPADTGVVRGSLTLESNDQVEPVVSITLTGKGGLQLPDISYSASEHDFGPVTIGESVDWGFSLSNEGLVELSIQSIVSSVDVFTVLSPPFPQSLEPNTSLVVLIQFMPSSSGPVEGMLTISSDDPDEALVSISLNGRGEAVVAPEIGLSAYSHLFGQIAVGQVSDWDVTISNGGNADLTVEALESNHAEFVHLTPVFPQVLSPNTELTASIRFTPLSIGVKEGTIRIISDDPDEDTVLVSVSGEGILSALTPRIHLSADEHDFGLVKIGNESPWSIQVSNTGMADLIISDIDSDQASFTVSAPSLPMTIYPGGDLTVEVTFAPATLGLKAGALTISSNDPDNPEVHVFVSGTGVSEVAVQLLHFSATCHDGQVLLTWRTSSEEWLAGFQLLRKDPQAVQYRLITAEEIGAGSNAYTYIDLGCGVEGEYAYQLVALDTQGRETILGYTSAKVEHCIPSEMVLGQNYPNPFNPETAIQYAIGQAGWVDIGVYNILGQRVRTLVAQHQQPGYYSVSWGGDDVRGRPVDSGLYIARLTVGGSVEHVKMMLLK